MTAAPVFPAFAQAANLDKSRIASQGLSFLRRPWTRRKSPVRLGSAPISANTIHAGLFPAATLRNSAAIGAFTAMIAMAITAEAYEAIKSTLLGTANAVTTA
jgi:hypothetical protein